MQGSEHNSFLRRRALWFWLQALQMILYVVIIVLCVATPHNFAGSSSGATAPAQRCNSSRAAIPSHAFPARARVWMLPLVCAQRAP